MQSNADSPEGGTGGSSEARSERQMSNLLELLGNLDESTGARPTAKAERSKQDFLVDARLGAAGSLFRALRCRHEPTAAHCLRVALGCSSWALAAELPDEECSRLEIAALLHDVGKIGVPDNVLLKPSRLSPHEASVMARHWQTAPHILARCCGDLSIIDLVRNAATWFDGRNRPGKPSGRRLPLGARMLAIVDAYDSMTTDSVYRPAKSRDRAHAELFECAGTQFDPDLVEQFVELSSRDATSLHAKVTNRWLHSLAPDLLGSTAGGAESESLPNWKMSMPHALFHHKLLDNMHDGVVFVDSSMRILMWNQGAVRLTGIPASSVIDRHWIPSLVSMRDERGVRINDDDCPVQYAVQTGVQSLQRLCVTARDRKDVAINLHTVPVIGPDGTTHGATLLLHDASSETSLEERCQALHEKATRDPLTGVANRAEFDRVHEQFVAAHVERGLPCSLIITDIDHFKSVNDTYGHQAGDEALKVYAGLLKSSCRQGDLVARYGGEEFVMLCADCSNATGAQRAEQIRRALAERNLEMLGGRAITASFGVTEVQPGDTPETMLARADRALLQAKEYGRNRVVQLGDGIGESAPRKTLFSWWTRQIKPDQLLEQHLVTPSPLKVTVEKLRGFVADHYAEIVSINGNDVLLHVDGGRASILRRVSDRSLPFYVELNFEEQHLESDELDGGPRRSSVRTRIHAVVRPKRNRDRRKSGAVERAKQVLASLRSYLMATDAPPDADAGAIRRATNLVSNWLLGPKKIER